VQVVLPAVAAHRLEQRSGAGLADGARLAADLLAAVPVPV